MRERNTMGENLKIGDTAYMSCVDNFGGFVVPAQIVEVQDIFYNPEMPDEPPVWRNTYQDGLVSFSQSGKQDLTESCLDGKVLVNTLYWLDEPVGHAIWLDGSDGVYENLNEALRNTKPSKRKKLKIRLKQRRRLFERFIAKTWKKAKLNHPGFKKRPDKKIYVRKK